MKVAIYIRESGTRQYKPASPRAMYPSDVTFCLRYTLGGKRRWEQLSVSTYKEAQAQSLRRLGDLITEKCAEASIGSKISKNLALPTPRPKPVPKPTVQTGELMLDAALDKYLENVATKSSKTSNGYRYTLQQFCSSTGNLALSQVTTQQLYDFVAYLRREGLGDRIVHNRVGEVVTFLQR